MSRIGKKPIPVPDKVKVDIKPDAVVVTGPKGTVTQSDSSGNQVRAEGQAASRHPPGRQRPAARLSRLARALVANAVRGVTEGFTRELEIVGVGYRAEQKKNSVRVHARLFASNRVSDSSGNQYYRR